MGFSLVSLFEIFYHLLGAVGKWWNSFQKGEQQQQKQQQGQQQQQQQQQQGQGQQQQIETTVELLKMENSCQTTYGGSLKSHCNCSCKVKHRKSSLNNLTLNQMSLPKSPSINIGSIHSCERLL
jgi:type II secretory pathway pseudopilin PulG